MYDDTINNLLKGVAGTFTRRFAAIKKAPPAQLRTVRMELNEASVKHLAVVRAHVEWLLSSEMKAAAIDEIMKAVSAQVPELQHAASLELELPVETSQTLQQEMAEQAQTPLGGGGPAAKRQKTTKPNYTDVLKKFANL